MRVVLAGQPNSGKSTVFNHVAGIKTVTSNFPGTTVKYTRTRVRVENEVYECIDLPGTYSLLTMDLAELEARKYLLSGKVDVIINVVDASLLCRSLEFTLQLLELELPLVVSLNMMDEAARKGIRIEPEKLADILGVPVMATIANSGTGLRELFQQALQVYRQQRRGNLPQFHKHVEDTVAVLSALTQKCCAEQFQMPARFLALRLLEGDSYYQNKVRQLEPDCDYQVAKMQRELEEAHGRPADEVISSERHALALDIYEKVTIVEHAQVGIRDKLDRLIMHPYAGYLFLVVVLIGFFYFIFRFGKLLEGPLLGLFDGLIGTLKTHLPAGSLWFSLVEGLLQGIAGGVAIVLPYLVPFLLGLAFLEDVGYLPRAASLMDVFLHRIGLHGKAVIPFILGYGCNVPAVMGTRILESPRDRVIASVLATMVPCAARTSIIFGLVAFFLGPLAALSIYLLNIVVIAATGNLLARLLLEETPGLILEIPVYRPPSWRVLLLKTWLRLREFILIAWPLLIAGSLILSLLSYLQMDDPINRLLAPFTTALELPAVVGITLIFGILRKELSLIMLLQALGTTQVLTVLSPAQVMTFTIFVVFYFPCLATLGVLIKEVGGKWAGFAVLFNTVIAFLLALATRGVMGIF